MEELIEETFPEEIEETTVVTEVPEETTIVTTVPDEETTTVIETLETDAEVEPSTFEYISGDMQLLFESNDIRQLYERIQLDNEAIIENQSEVIVQLKEQNAYLSEMNTVLANFFFCFMVLMVCKFVHFQYQSQNQDFQYYF